MYSLIQTIYASRVGTDFHEHQIPDLLRQIRPANARDHVTGMLLYFGTSFLQALEGPAASVDAAYSRVKFDPRHTEITRITREPLRERQFPDWTMDFATIDPSDIGALIGEPELRDAISCMSLTANRAKSLLAALTMPSWSNPAEGRARRLRAAGGAPR